MHCGPCLKNGHLGPGQEPRGHPDAPNPGRERGEAGGGTRGMKEEEAVNDRTLIMPIMALSVDLLISSFHVFR